MTGEQPPAISPALGSSRPLRFVVLLHTGFGEDHYDLMFEREDRTALRTIRVARWPIVGETAARSLPDHRLAYLDYEGPVSGGRGTVRRVARGQYTLLQDPHADARGEPSYALSGAPDIDLTLRLLLNREREVVAVVHPSARPSPA
jgi:hypothetical protein